MRNYYFIFLIFIVTNCSRIEFATDWADTYLTTQIDHYFDINSLQARFVKTGLKEGIQQVRVKIFPKIAEEFKKILSEVDKMVPFTGEIVAQHELNLKNIFYETLSIFEPSSVEFSTQLNIDQLENFKKEFQKKNKDLLEDLGNPSEMKDKQFNKIRKQLEAWIGNLNSAQKKELEKHCALNPTPLREMVRNRELLAQQFGESFPVMEKRKKFVSDILLSYEKMRDPEYSKIVQEDQKSLFATIADILNHMTNDQRKHLSETLKDRIQQLKNASEKK